MIFIIGQRTFDTTTSKKVAKSVYEEDEPSGTVRDELTLYRTRKGTYWVHTRAVKGSTRKDGNEFVLSDSAEVLKNAEEALTWIDRNTAAVSYVDGFQLPPEA